MRVDKSLVRAILQLHSTYAPAVTYTIAYTKLCACTLTTVRLTIEKTSAYTRTTVSYPYVSYVHVLVIVE